MTLGKPNSKPAPWFLQGGGVSGETARSVDWASTPLGPPESWPSILKSLVATMFRARQPMFLWWGEDLIQIYNDAYLPSFGKGKHPRAMGQRGRECWQEIWPIIGPQIENVMERAVGSWNEDELVPIFRNDKIEEVYWTYTYSPVFAEDGTVAGTLVICTETTNRVLGERRTNLLHSLSSTMAAASEAPELITNALKVFSQDACDLPFVAFCRLAGKGEAIEVVDSVGVDAVSTELLTGDLNAKLGYKFDEGLISLAETSAVPAMGFAEPVRDVYAIRLLGERRSVPWYVVFGISPKLVFDAGYRRFLQQVAAYLQVGKTRIEEISQRAAIETEQATTRRVLETAYAERERLLRNVEEASRAKDEFLAMLGHELRNPLSPILTALQLLRHKSSEGISREQQVIERQVTHLTRLVDDLLDVSKIARGKVELRRELVDICDVIGKAVEMASDLFEQRQHRLTLKCERGRYICYADPIRLSQVIANLLTNAAKYTDRGGNISVRASEQEGELVVLVKDSGMGIKPDMLPRVFNLFEQAKRSVDRTQGGLGIGLALVKNLVLLHGGTVSAHSEGAGKGSEFVVRMPLAKDAQRSEPVLAEEGSVAQASSPKRILVVDDNVDAAELLKATLEASGHEVAVATDALVALDVASGLELDVAILDIGLPVIDGHELAGRLRALPSCSSCRLIALTGYGQEHDRQRSRQAGFQEHMVKPVDVNRLLKLVDAA